MLSVNSQNPFHFQKCGMWPLLLQDLMPKHNTKRKHFPQWLKPEGNSFHVHCTAARCLCADTPAAAHSQSGKEALMVLERRGICRDAWEALTRYSLTECLTPAYLFHIPLVRRLKSPRSQCRSICFQEAMHIACTAEDLSGGNKLSKACSQGSVLCTFPS